MMRKILSRLFLLLLVAGVAGGGYGVYRYQRFLAEPLVLPAEGYHLLIPPGASLRTIARQLAGDGVLSEPHLLRIMARIDGSAARIQAGEYLLPAGMAPPGLMRMLVRGEVVQHSLTIIEGWTFQQMMSAIQSHPMLKRTLADASGPGVMAVMAEAGLEPEGWFYPDTYRFPRDTTDVEFLRRAFRNMQQRLELEWEARAEGLPLKTPYEALILASLIERETAVPAERTRIAGVFIRRLQKGMRLQTDPTVIYGMGDAYQGKIRWRDLRADTPYNTYTRHGLPPTPIAMPSGASIRAALNPADGDELYFVSRGDGSHQFSATLQEHNAAVRRYQLGER
jgi:UPF0755 protein